MTKKSDKEISAADILASLERLARLARAAEHSEGLNPVQWDALRYLAHANRFSNSPVALTHYLVVTKGTLSQTLASLVKKGLIAKQERNGDQRSVVLELTEQGRATLDRDPAHHIDKAISKLSIKTQRRFARGVAELLQAELKRQDRPSFGTCTNCRHFSKQDDQLTCKLLTQDLSKAELHLICVEHKA